MNQIHQVFSDLILANLSTNREEDRWTCCVHPSCQTNCASNLKPNLFLLRVTMSPSSLLRPAGRLSFLFTLQSTFPLFFLSGYQLTTVTEQFVGFFPQRASVSYPAESSGKILILMICTFGPRISWQT